MRLSPPQLETIRSRPQQTDLFLSIFRPRPVMKCQVNGAITRGAREIPYDSVSMGSFSDVIAGMTMLVGTSDGARDLGKIRIRSVDGTSFIVAENSDIEWADNVYLTVLRFWEMWPVYPRIINDPSNNENVIFYKDYDIAYTNQNTILGTLVNAGTHRAIFRDCASGLAQTEWYSTGTHSLVTGTTLNYNWIFEGGTPSSSSLANPGLVQYPNPGHYVTSLSISGSNGAVDSTYRYVSVYDFPGCGTGTPPTQWQFSDLGGSRSEGGYTVDLVLNEIVDIDEGDVVVIFANDWYGDTKVSLGGNSPGSESIVFAGYVLDGTIQINYINSTVRFQAGSITQIMKMAEGFSISVESKASPSTWFELLNMNCERAMYHYMKWHSTVLNIADFQFLGTDQNIQFYDADRGSLYDAVDSLVRSALVGEVVSDRQSKMWSEISAYAVPNATGTFIPAMELTKRDWMNEPNIEINMMRSLSQLEMGGIAYSGPATGTFSALLSNAPGDTPSYRGTTERIQGLALSDQDQLNQLVGNVFTNRNSTYPTIDVDLAGNYRNLDIAPQDAVTINILAQDNMSGKQIRAPYVPTSMQWRFDSKTKLFYPSTTFSVITSGLAGQTIIIPDLPPDEGFSNPAIGSSQASPTFPVPSISIGAGIKSYLVCRPSSTSLNALRPQINNIIYQYGTAFDTSHLNIGRIDIQTDGYYHFSLDIPIAFDGSSPLTYAYMQVIMSDSAGTSVTLRDGRNTDATSAGNNNAVHFSFGFYAHSGSIIQLSCFGVTGLMSGLFGLVTVEQFL